MEQNRDSDENMPQCVAPSTNIVNPAPLGVRISTMVNDRVDWMVEYDF